MTTATIINAITASILMGLIYGIATIGFSLGYRHLKFPDFTTLSAIMVGGVTCIVVTNQQPALWIFGLLSGMIAGGLLGLCTGLQITYCKIPPTLAGITTFTGAGTLAFVITGNNADVSLPQAGNVFSWAGGAVGILELIVVAFVVSRIFSTRYGDYILALQGTNNYVDHRHHCVNGTVNGLLVLSNAIIGLAGALAAFQNGQASVKNHEDFLVLALAGYSLGAKIIFEVNKLSEGRIRDGSNFLFAQGLPLLTPAYRWFVDKVTRNDEEPIKIWITLCTYGCATVFINAIFKLIEIEFADKNMGYLLKAALLFLVLWMASSTTQVSSQKSDE